VISSVWIAFGCCISHIPLPVHAFPLEIEEYFYIPDWKRNIGIRIIAFNIEELTNRDQKFTDGDDR
jgi:hypothetical protein